ncbi:SAM-dependent methyltransferase, partial [Streptomyces bacillaris]
MTDTAPLPRAAAEPAAAQGTETPPAIAATASPGAETPAVAPAAASQGTGTPAAPPPGLRDFYENPAVPVASGDGRSLRQARLLAAALAGRPGGTVVDVGCGGRPVAA